MNVDKHVLFLIVIIGIISAGIVGATVMNTDTSMKQEVFDGMTVSVPADSEFVKVGDGVYKDSHYGITINTFKNNDSMIDFLKNSKKSKIIPIENQPPQSVAFKKGDTINILVTNGNEGLSVSTKDGDLTSKIANSIIFSNNHKSQKSNGLGLVKPHMNIHQDFNLIMILVADVDTKIFNTAIFEDNLNVFVDEYNEDLGQDGVSDDASSNGESDEYVSDVKNSDDLNNVLSESSDSSSDDSSSGNDDDDAAQTTVVDDNSNDASSSDDVAQASGADEPSNVASDNDVVSSAPDTSSAPASSSPSGSGSSSQQELSFDDCQKLAEKEIMSHPDLAIDDKDHDEIPDCYVFFVIDMDNNKIGEITVNALTGDVDLDSNLKSIL
ncbi:hypothetical protein [Methanobrevibacter sp.]|uniref:hypothetical protein n=1 Tax=Methanobrevibacter sp. TaxID=66852 RepID=UPI003863A437